MKLSDVKVDQMATIRALGTDTHFLSRVTSVGMTEGTRVQVVRNDKKMPLLIYVRESHSLKWTARVAIFYFGSALLLSCIVYHLASLFM